jgi:hypothetical protein
MLFSCLTGSTGSIEFFSQFPEETEKEESRCAGKIENRILHFLWSGIISISGLTPKPSPAAFGGVGFCPSVREGQNNNKNRVNPVYPPYFWWVNPV